MDFLDALAIDNAADQLRDADLSEHARRETDAQQAAVSNYTKMVRQVDINLREIDQNSELSPEGRRRQDDRLERWTTQTERQLADLENRAAYALTEARGQVRPPRLHIDATTETARLEAAKSDVRMILETTPTAQLPDRLAELARSEVYGDMAYLLSVTQFGRACLEARGLAGYETTA